MHKIPLREIVKKSVFGSVGALLSENDFVSQIKCMTDNLSFLNNFHTVMYSLNGSSELIERFGIAASNLLEKNIDIVTSPNLGHTFGTFLLDYNIFSYANNIACDYIWKFSNDTIVQESILDFEVNLDIDFYYINNIGYNAFNTYSKKQLLEAIYNGSYFYPQTYFYIIKNYTKFYPGPELIMELKIKYDSIKCQNPGIQPWETIEISPGKGCDCEHMIAKTVLDNNLSKQYLLSNESTSKIIDIVYKNNIGDGSHKNIAYSELGHLCHFHYLNHSVCLI